MSFFAGLNAEDYDRQYADRELYGRILAYFRPHVWRLIGTVVLLLVVSGLGAWLPIVVSQGVDEASINPTIDAIYRVFLWVFLIGVGRWLANWLNRRFMIRIVANVMFQLAKDAFQ